MGDFAGGDGLDQIITRILDSYQPPSLATPEAVRDALPRLKVNPAAAAAAGAAAYLQAADAVATKGATAGQAVAAAPATEAAEKALADAAGRGASDCCACAHDDSGAVPPRYASCAVGEACTICHDEFSSGAEVIELGCRHCFHPACILPWLETRNTCPVCRTKVADAEPTAAPQPDAAAPAAAASNQRQRQGGDLWGSLFPGVGVQTALGAQPAAPPAGGGSLHDIMNALISGNMAAVEPLLQQLQQQYGSGAAAAAAGAAPDAAGAQPGTAEGRSRNGLDLGRSQAAAVGGAAPVARAPHVNMTEALRRQPEQPAAGIAPAATAVRRRSLRSQQQAQQQATGAWLLNSVPIDVEGDAMDVDVDADSDGVCPPSPQVRRRASGDDAAALAHLASSPPRAAPAAERVALRHGASSFAGAAQRLAGEGLRPQLAADSGAAAREAAPTLAAAQQQQGRGDAPHGDSGSPRRRGGLPVVGVVTAPLRWALRGVAGLLRMHPSGAGSR